MANSSRIQIALFVILVMYSFLPVWGSSGGGSWTKCSCNPILSPGRDSGYGWDWLSVWSPRVIFDGKTYHMWYAGSGQRQGIGYATSLNALNWTRSAEPVLMPTRGGWDSTIRDTTVIMDSNTFKMWYVGENGTRQHSIGYATSPDGKAWSKYSEPVLNRTVNGPDAVDLRYPWVVKDGQVYKMWYTGLPTNGKASIVYAESSNGIQWIKKGIVLKPGPGLESWDNASVQSPSVILNQGLYLMWYTGSGPPLGLFQIGFAYSNNGMNWTKYAGNPVLMQGTVDAWDGRGVGDESVILVGSTFKMYYTSGPPYSTSIGYAEAPQASVIPEFPVVQFPVLAAMISALVSLSLLRRRKRLGTPR